MEDNFQKEEELDFQILVSAINHNLPKIENYDHLIINQLHDEDVPEIKRDNVFNYYEKGISKSRNRALQHATADICLISDDDVRYKPDTKDKILWAFENNPKADIITFQIETPAGKPYKDYPNKKFRHDPQTLMDVSSVEIAFRKKSVIENHVRFDERFGLGSVFPTGEELVFLTDALKSNLKVLYIPEAIVIHPEESWNDKWTIKKYIQAKGALLYRVFGWKAILWICILSYKKYQLSDYSLPTYFKYMINGIIEFKKLDSQNSDKFSNS